MKTAADELEFFNSTHSVFRAHLLVQNESWSFIDGTSNNKQKSILQKPDWQLSEGYILTIYRSVIKTYQN